MKNYKDYNKTYIGSSERAYLTLKTITGTTEKLCFGEDGSVKCDTFLQMKDNNC